MSELVLRVAADSAHGASVSGLDVVAEVEADQTVGELAAALADHLGLSLSAGCALLRVERTGAVPATSTPVDGADLVSGDIVTIGDSLASRSSSGGCDSAPEPVATLAVVAGRDAGRRFDVTAPVTTVGRGPWPDIALTDPAVSRHHATVRVGPRADLSIVAAPGATNAVTVDGRSIDPGEETALPVSATVGLGSTRLRIERGSPPVGARRRRHGRVEFHRTPYRPVVVASPAPTPVGPIPERPRQRRLQTVAAAAPVVAGVGMYLVTRHAQFLLFTLVSPVVMIGTALDDRRAGRRDFRREVAAFRVMLAERRAEFEALAAGEVVARGLAAPDLATLVRRMCAHTIDLWERGRDAPDVGRLRLGLGADTTSFAVELEPHGDDDLRDEARQRLDDVTVLDEVPVTFDLADGPLAVHGPDELVAGVVRSLVLQAAALHSPDDMTIVAAVSTDADFDWLRWLPHLRSVTSPLAGPHLVVTSAEADSLVAALAAVAASRQSGDGRGSDRCWPRVLVVLDGRLRPDPAVVARLFDAAAPRGGDVGIGIIWLAEGPAEVPRQARRVLVATREDGGRMRGRLWSTDPAVPCREFDLEHLGVELACIAARALAPVRDVSTASRTSSIPRSAPLLDVAGLGALGPGDVLERWRAAGGHRLAFVIGAGADGPLELDLVADGPHALIGGTSGSGKSELVQSMVATLAANHPPTRLNFLFVDYKGGASSQVFERLPHTVGHVTNLSADLAGRALTSLRAELEHRMAVLDGKAKDLAEMLATHPDDAPPVLVIVVDEFATLVRQVPEFMAGIVDIAQRGRSLGIHIVLATQRPTGSVDENILANTNLRIALRMIDRADSTAIIDAPDAAGIPVPMRGRGFVRRGPHRLDEFQAAYGGALYAADASRRPVRVRDLACADCAPEFVVADGDGSTTHLDVVLGAICEAGRRWGGDPPRRPWREPLPAVVGLGDVVQGADPTPGRDIVIGLLDRPELQDQRPAVIDLEATGGLVVFGTGGSGKTTLLRSVAAGVELAGPGAVSLVFDFAARGLVGLADLPSVIDVATGDDLEAVTRHLLMLDAELDRRQRLLAAASAEHLTAYLESADPPDSTGVASLDRIVVLIDGFGALSATLLDPARPGTAGDERWFDIVHRVVTDGRRCGIHTVIAADRRSALPSRLQSAIGSRLVLRHADPQSYADLGVRADRAAALDHAPGRAVLDGTTLVQVASVGDDPSARAQSAAIAALGRTATPSTTTIPATRRTPASTALPDRVHATGPGVIGVADVTGEPVAIDSQWSHAAIVGRPRSGRSTALLAFVSALAGSSTVHLVGPASSGLAGLDVVPPERVAFGGVAEVGDVLDRIANVARADDRRPIVVAIDDLDRLDDPVLEPVWRRLLESDRIRLVASVESRSMSGYTTSPALAELRHTRLLLALQPDDPGEFLQLTGVRLPQRPGLRWPPGRGVLIADRMPTVMHANDSRSSDRDFALVGRAP